MMFMYSIILYMNAYYYEFCIFMLHNYVMIHFPYNDVHYNP